MPSYINNGMKQCLFGRRALEVGRRRMQITAPCRPYFNRASCCPIRAYHSMTTNTAATPETRISFRKGLKEQAKQRKTDATRRQKRRSQVIEGWELTVGIEIHAQLNTSRKLFSSAATAFNEDPNSHVALFDLSIPGSQPAFQKESLVPALRAALALNCDIQETSSFDRKHYFWWDQPSGYQITQYYQPFARDGTVTLLGRDGIAAEDGESTTVRIKQVQLEQDTAKTVAQAGDLHWLDFNRVGTPLIEIITEPDIHHPSTAAAFVRKVQLLLSAVDACVSGMEIGGLRADINVSVRRTGDGSSTLGSRTEIKNLSTIKAVEDAIFVERDRQIRELEAGRTILSETRGWAVGSTESRRLRGKEGEVDYRYMPDPDLRPLVIDDELVQHLRSSLAVLPDAELDDLINKFGLPSIDAVALINADGGQRAQYFYKVVDSLGQKLGANDMTESGPDVASFAPLVGNWVSHELGRLTTSKAGPLASAELTFSEDAHCYRIPHEELAELLQHLYKKKITGKVAKELLFALYLGELQDGVLEAIQRNDLWFHELSNAEYLDLIVEVLDAEQTLTRTLIEAEEVPKGKLMYLVGAMMRQGATERIDALTAERLLRTELEKRRAML